jgi:viroplasmin and RNaseH domain-containing protein
MRVIVDIIESERGWGQRVDETKTFPSREAAEKFCREYNKDNNKATVPDWYMYARIRGDEWGMLR